MNEARSIIITGAGSGIGRVTARHFMANGWKVGLIGRRRKALEETAADNAALIMPCDVTDEGAVENAFESASRSWDRIDVLFNNAGRSLPPADPDQMSVTDFRDLINVNVTGMFICARAAFARMRRQAPMGGRIINNGSISAHVPRSGSIAYTTSKHAITGMTRSLSLDGRRYSIACGQIDIGNAATDLLSTIQKPDGQAEPMMDASVVASTVMQMASLPDGANMQFATVMATNMPFIGRG